MNASKYAKQRMQLADKCKHSDQSPQTAVTVPQYTTSAELPSSVPQDKPQRQREATEGHSEAVGLAKGAA